MQSCRSKTSCHHWPAHSERLNSPPLSLKALKGKVMLRFLDHGVQAYALTFG
jgi:hypothetical protein